eukprot:2670456-Alexandrium_andersonii.AAC.1
MHSPSGFRRTPSSFTTGGCPWAATWLTVGITFASSLMPPSRRQSRLAAACGERSTCFAVA